MRSGGALFLSGFGERTFVQPACVRTYIKLSTIKILLKNIYTEAKLKTTENVINSFNKLYKISFEKKAGIWILIILLTKRVNNSFS